MPSAPYGTTGTTATQYVSPFTIGGGTSAILPPAVLSNVCFNSYDNENAFIQNNIQNTSNGTNASSDWISTADNGTDTTGYVDCGINNSGYNVATWTINGALDAYHYCAGGGLAIGTDTAGKNLVFFTGGTLAANSRMVVQDSQILFQVPRTSTAKTIVNNGATATYTLPVASDYIYITTTATALTVTYPAAAAAIDGREITIVTSIGVATATFSSSGATFVGAPAAFTANVPVKFKYHHAATQWLPC